MSSRGSPMPQRAVLLSTLVMACSPPTDDREPHDSGDPTLLPTGETAAGATGETGAPASSLTADCAPTDNALRFACTVTVDPPAGVRVRYGPSDGSLPERVAESPTALGTHALTLALMIPETEYAFVAEPIAGGDGVEGAFVTGEPPTTVMSRLAVTGTPSVPYVGTNLPCGPDAVGTIYDTATGELAWYGQLDPDGNLGLVDMIQFTEDHTVLGETNGRVVEMDLAGNVLFVIEEGPDFTTTLHHDLFKRNGYIYTIYQLPVSSPTLDGFYVWDALTGERVAEWDAPSYVFIPGTAVGDWMHTNTIWVDAAGDVYLSSYAQNSILKVRGDWTSPDFGAPVWAMAGSLPAGFGDDVDIDWGELTPPSFVNQHDAHGLADGRFVMLDNLHGRGLVLSLDQGSLTATVDGAYPTELGSCGPQGTTAVASTGDVFVGCSGGGLLEYSPSGEPVWHAEVVCPAGGASSARFYPLEGW